MLWDTLTNTEGLDMYELNVGRYDPQLDVIEIEGTKYSGEMFRGFGINAMVGQTLRIDRRDDGVITVTRLPFKQQ